MLSENDKLKLKDLDIRQVAERLGIEVKDRGNSHCFNTTFHANGDRNPSLSFDSRTNRFKCFACGISGDTIELVKAYKGIDNFREAYAYLAQIMGVSIDTETKANIKETYRPYKGRQAVEMRLVDHKYPENPIYKAFYDLCTPPNNELKKWWAGRGLSERTLSDYGWRVMAGDTMAKLSEQYSEDELLESGLKKVKDGKVVDSFRGGYKVIVPLFNGGIESLGTPGIIGVRARDLKAEKPYPKYLPPIGQPHMIYRLDKLYEWLCDTTKAPLFITGSETDNAAMAEYLRLEGEPGYVVGLTGEAKSENSADLLELAHEITSVSKNVPILVVADNDKAGDAFYQVVCDSLFKAGVDPDNLGKFQPHAKEGLKDIGDYVKMLVERRTDTPDIKDIQNQ